MSKEIDIEKPLITLSVEKRAELTKRLIRLNPQALQPDGYEEAFIGYVWYENRYLGCYSVLAIINIMQGNNLTYLEAIEHFEYNISGAYVGENIPIFLHDDDIAYHMGDDNEVRDILTEKIETELNPNAKLPQEYKEALLGYASFFNTHFACYKASSIKKILGDTSTNDDNSPAILYTE